MRRNGQPPACLLSVILCLAHRAGLHSQVLQTTAADKDLAGLGASAVTYLPISP